MGRKSDRWQALRWSPAITPAAHWHEAGGASYTARLMTRLTGLDAPALETEFDLPDGPTEVTRIARTPRVQGFFRAAVLASYEYRCALSDIALPELLNASHIIPWKVHTARRADPRNGIALNTHCDRAFDRGLITFDESLRLVVSPRLKLGKVPLLRRQAILY
jgi:hypothetical protein